MKIGPERPLPNGGQAPVYANLRQELITAINQRLSIRQVATCDMVAAYISKAIYGTFQSDVDGIELNATGEGAGRVIPPDADFIRVLNFSFLKHETAVFHFFIAAPLAHHFTLIPWYDERQPCERGYTMYMAYAVNGDGNSNGPGTYSVGEYIDRSVNLASPYRDVWTQGELLVMLKNLFTTETAWSNYFLNGKNSLANRLIVYKYDSIEIHKAIRQVRRL